MPKLGDRARCQVCGGKIILIDDFRMISLGQGIWMHSGWVRRFTTTHPAVGPS